MRLPCRSLCWRVRMLKRAAPIATYRDCSLPSRPMVAGKLPSSRLLNASLA